MGRKRQSDELLVTVATRVDADRPALIEQAAEARGMTRAQWLRRLIDRGLEGAGLLAPGTHAAVTGSGRKLGEIRMEGERVERWNGKSWERITGSQPPIRPAVVPNFKQGKGK